MRESLVETREDGLDVLNWYEELSNGYEELYGEEQSRKYIRVFKELSLRSHLTRKNQVILDLGCGTSSLIKFLCSGVSSTAFSYYVGLDLSPSMCFMSRKRINRAGLLGDVVAGDIFRLPFRGGIADTVLSITVLTCRDPLKEVILGFKNLLRNNGLLCYTVLCSDFRAVLEHDFELCESTTSLSQREVLCVIKS